jgi:hypothetical protein
MMSLSFIVNLDEWKMKVEKKKKKKSQNFFFLKMTELCQSPHFGLVALAKPF